MRYPVACAVTIFLWSFAALANGPLRSIIIFGNEKTERETILSIINVESQTFVNQKLIQEVDDRLANAGLFKKVTVVKADNQDGTTDLRVTVVEKQLWFIFPTFTAWSKRYSGGLAFGESNLFVPNGRTFFLLEAGNKLSRVFGLFDARNVEETNFAVRTWILGRQDDVPLYSGKNKVGEIEIRDAAISVIPGFQWTNDIRTSVGFTYRYVDYGNSTLVPESGTRSDDLSITFKFEHDSLRRREALLKGNRLEASYEFSESQFGGDVSYHIEEVEFEQAIELPFNLNWILLFQGALGDKGLPFHRQLTLGGATLRGYTDREFRGDTRVVAKQDLLFRILRHKNFSVFGDVFYDMGLLYFDAAGISRSNFRNGAGAGIRVSLADILSPVFGFDVAYGIEDRALRMYFALGIVQF